MAERPSQIGPFDIVDELGRGAMGVVYRAHHRELDREFALKVVGAGVSERPDALARFKREAQAAARLAGHPNIVGVHQIGDSDGTAWFSMDLIDGESLENLIDEGDLPLDEAARILAKAARAVDHAHDQSVLHRDLKPANILVAHDGEVYVTDFGLARLQDVHGDLTRITTSDLLVGTPAYMAPEQIHGERLDGRTDVYALGATLYEAITGQTPFPGKSVLSVLTKVVQEPPALPTTITAGIPADLEAICLRALAKQPEDRYPTAILFAEELEAFLAGKPILARRSSAIGRLGKRFRRNRKGMLLGAVLGASAVGVAATLWIASQQRTIAPETVEQAEQGRSDAELAADLALANFEIAKGTREPMKALLHRFHGGWDAEEHLAEALRELHAVCDRVQAAHPNSRAPEAWRRYAAHLADPSEATYEAVIAYANEGHGDPYPAIIGARVALMQYALRLTVPAYYVTAEEISREKFVEYAFQRGFRDDLAECLNRIAGSRYWGQVPEAATLEEFAQGATLLLAGNWDKVVEAFTPLMSDPSLEIDAAQVVAYAHFQREEYLQAAAVWARLADRGWYQAMEDANVSFEAAISRRLLDRKPIDDATAQFRAYLDVMAKRHATHPQQWRARSDAHRWLAGLARKVGADPRPDLETAVAAAEKLLEIYPQTVYAHAQRGSANMELFKLRREQGEGAAERFEAVRADLEEARRRRPKASTLLGQLGILYATAADEIPDGDPRAIELLEKAIEHFSAEIEERDKHPEDAADRTNRANAYMQLAGLHAAAGRQRADLVNLALQDLERSRQLFPDKLGIEIATAGVYLYRADLAVQNGHDPVPDIRLAIDVFNRVLHRSPGRVAARSNRGLAHRRLAEELSLRGRPHRESYDAAVRDMQEVVRRSPGEASYHMNLASVLRSRGESTRVAGGDPAPDFAAAIASLDHAVTLAPTLVSAWGTRGQTKASLAQLHRTNWETASKLYQEALADLSEALRLAPQDVRSLASRGDVWRDWADTQARFGHDGKPSMIKALEDYGRALEVIPGHPIILYNRARAHERISYYSKGHGAEWEPAAEAGIKDLIGAVEGNPRLAPAWHLMGRLQRRLGRLEEALATYDQALRLRPGFQRYVKERREIEAELAQQGK